MSAHLWESKVNRINRKTKTLLTTVFTQATKLGYNETEAARFAAQYVERQHQGGGLPEILPPELGVYYRPAFPVPKRFYAPGIDKSWLKDYWPAWRLGLGIHCSEYTYHRVLGNPLKGDDGLANIQPVLERYAKLQPKVHARIMAALTNIQTVCPEWYRLKASMVNHNARTCGLQAAWTNIKRGSDLFIPGMGSFDLKATIDHCIRHPGSRNPVYGLPSAITSIGYALRFNANPYYLADILFPAEQVGQYPYRQRIRELVRQHFIQHFQFWVVNEHLDLLAQACYNLDLTAFEDNPAPQVLLARLMADRRYNEWLEEGELVQGLTSESFAWCQWLPYNIGEYTARTPATPDELRAVAKQMKNCAAGYGYSVAERRSLIVVFYNAGGKPVAMADLKAKSRTYSQLKGPCNQPLPKDLHALFASTAKHFATMFAEASQLNIAS